MDLVSGFSSLNVGSQALNAAQRALDVTGQNVSNVNTDGYSRQRVQQTSRGASVIPAMWSRSDSAAGGVDVTGTQRIRDSFLEARAHQEHATYAGLTSLSRTYTDLESTFGEPSSTGLQAQMATFWNSWQDLSNNPGDAGPASLVLEHAKTLAGTVNGFATQLSQQWAATRDQVDSTVADVNSLAAEVARLNGAIRSATLNGGAPNELSDQRDVLVLRIAEATGAVATAGDNGVVNLTLAGRTLVSVNRSEKLQAQGPASYPALSGTVARRLQQRRRGQRDRPEARSQVRWARPSRRDQCLRELSRSHARCVGGHRSAGNDCRRHPRGPADCTECHHPRRHGRPRQGRGQAGGDRQQAAGPGRRPFWPTRC